MGVDIIECGWPSINTKDFEVFRKLKEYSLESKIAAFTSTRRKDLRVDKDPVIVNTLKVEPDVVVVFGKSWILHVREVLRLNPEDNVKIIIDTIQFFKDHGIEVIFDAEHFFDGFKDDKEYALRILKEVENIGVRTIVLCDTNGGMLPHEVYSIVNEVIKNVDTMIGVHMHNDSGNAVANTLMAVLAGARHVQVTINGIGERCGNADFCQVIPNLVFKLGFKVLKGRIDKLRKLTYISKLIYEITGISKNPYQPYVGEYAFTHKAGIHIDAVLKCPRAYEHINPELVGNTRQFTISELSGRSALIAKLSELGIKIIKNDQRLINALNELKELELRGYNFDVGFASGVLIILKELGYYCKYFDVIDWRVVSEGSENYSKAWSWIKIKANEIEILEAGEGVGPVHAADEAIRKALSKIYPEINNVKLIDYKVTLLGIPKHTASTVRVEVTFTDGKHIWTTTASSTNIIEASIKAIIDGIDYYLQIKNLLK